MQIISHEIKPRKTLYNHFVYVLFQWFRQIGWKDQDAVLHFPADLTKENRKQVHEIAQSFGLGTSSSGCGETVTKIACISLAGAR